jgi:hypothetical protein
MSMHVLVIHEITNWRIEALVHDASLWADPSWRAHWPVTVVKATVGKPSKTECECGARGELCRHARLMLAADALELTQ